MSSPAFQEPSSHPSASKPVTGGTSLCPPTQRFCSPLVPCGVFSSPDDPAELPSLSQTHQAAKTSLENSCDGPGAGKSHCTHGGHRTHTGLVTSAVVSKPLCLFTASVAPLRHLSPGSRQDLSSYVTSVPGSFSQIPCSATHQPSNQIKAGDLLFQSISPLN